MGCNNYEQLYEIGQIPHNLIKYTFENHRNEAHEVRNRTRQIVSQYRQDSNTLGWKYKQHSKDPCTFASNIEVAVRENNRQ